MNLSIVIPCYNMERYLPACLDSLVHQNLDPNNLQIIVVNDGSQDRTLEVAQQYSKSYPNIFVVDKKNNGVGAARNTGLDHATGSYIYFLDPDDYIVDNSLKPMLELMVANNLDILTFNTSSVIKDNHYTKVPFTLSKPLEIKSGIDYLASRKYINEIWWYFIRTDFLRKSNIRFIEGKWMEDAILTAELFCVAKRMAHIDFDMHRYRILPNSAMRNKTPAHYNKVIFDNANAAKVFEALIASVPNNHPNSDKAIKRLLTRQQSFVFFLLVRLMKSDLGLKEIKPLLEKFEPIGAYPLHNFLGEDYNGLNYRILVFIFNRKKLILPFMWAYRMITFNFN